MGVIKRLISMVALFMVLIMVVLTGCGSGSAANVPKTNNASNVPAANNTVNTPEASDAGAENTAPAQPVRIEGKAVIDGDKTVAVGDDSIAEFSQDGKKYTVTLEGGELYFCVPKAFEADESLTVDASAAAISIKEASGYIAVLGEKKTAVVVTTGSVEITASTGEKKTLEAGQCVLAASDGSKTEFSVSDIAPEDYPTLLLDELSQDDMMLGKIAEEIGESRRYEISAMAAYRSILADAENYDYQLDGAKASGRYRYAFVKLHADDRVPAILLRQESLVKSNNKTVPDEFEHIRIFQYDIKTGLVNAPEEDLFGDIENRYYVRYIAPEDEEGLIVWLRRSDNKRIYYVYRVELEEASLKTELIWQGSLSKDTPRGLSINWYMLSEDQFPGRIDSIALPSDGDRVVLSGIINTFSYSETVELQGIQDWNATDPNSKYRMIILDKARVLTGRGLIGDAPDGSDRRDDFTDMIYVKGADIPADLDGQHIVFSISSENLYWPSDSSVPAGKPHTSDVHIID